MAGTLGTAGIHRCFQTGITLLNPTIADCSCQDMGAVQSARAASFQQARDALNNDHPSQAGSDDHVRLVHISEYKEAALCLAEAFSEDDVARYLVYTHDREHCSAEEQWSLHLQIMEYIVYAHCLKGLVTTIGPGYSAVALWMPPGEINDDWLTLLRSGTWRLRYQLSREGRRRYFTEFLPLLHDTMHYVLGDRSDDAWYLVYLGTRTSGRGKGYAKKLIAHITTLCDEEQRPCYLESSNAANPAIYRKYGFEERRRVYLQGNADRNVELDIMVREPTRPLAPQEPIAVKGMEVTKFVTFGWDGSRIKLHTTA